MSIGKTSVLIPYAEIMAVYFEFPTKHINEFCGQNTEFLTSNVAVNALITMLLKG